MLKSAKIIIILIIGIVYASPAFAKTIEAETNKEFSITLRTEKISDLSGFMVDISFDPELISFIGVVKGNFLSADCKISMFSQKINPGNYNIGMRRLGDNCPGASGSGDLATLNFQSFKNTGRAAIEYSNSRFCILKDKKCDWRNKIWDSVAVNISQGDNLVKEIIVLGVEHEEDIEEISFNEAKEILNQAEIFFADNTSEEIFNKIITGEEKVIKGAVKDLILYFIQSGTLSTAGLGNGERAGVINSYFSAFNKFPETKEDWQDIIKISNGRWPNERSAEAEKRAKINFNIVYGREPNRANSHDDATITVMAYGLRPSNRNLDSEKRAISIFKAIYGYIPQKSTAWNVVRAIAYSGAKK